MSKIGKARPGDEPNIARTYDSDVHWSVIPLALILAERVPFGGAPFRFRIRWPAQSLAFMGHGRHFGPGLERAYVRLPQSMFYHTGPNDYVMKSPYRQPVEGRSGAAALDMSKEALEAALEG